MMKLLAAMSVGLILAGCAGRTTSDDTTRDTVHPKGQARMTAVDPVCGMEVNTASRAPSERFQGQTWWFCSDGCEMQFRSAPAAYVPGPRPDLQTETREAEVK